MVKKCALITAGGLLVVLGIGCVSAQLKSDVTALKMENQELQGQNERLTADCKALYRKNEMLLKELSQARNEDDYYARPATKKSDTELIRQLQSKGLEVIDREGNPAIVVTGIFNPGAATLSAEGKEKLSKVVKIIKSEASMVSIGIDGYTDDQPVKESKYKSNESLSLARADAVKGYMVDQKMNEKRIATRGLGAANPIADNKTPEGKQKNRRVEIVLLVN